MIVPAESWQARARAKRSATLAKIDPEWRLSNTELEKAAKQRDLTGPFIQQYFDADEQAILNQDAVTIVARIRKGDLTAKKVALSFCKAAAISHQIVSRVQLVASLTLCIRVDLTIQLPEQLSTRDILLASPAAGRGARQILSKAWQDRRPAPRSPRQSQRPISRKRKRHINGIRGLDRYLRGQRR